MLPTRATQVSHMYVHLCSLHKGAPAASTCIRVHRFHLNFESIASGNGPLELRRESAFGNGEDPGLYLYRDVSEVDCCVKPTRDNKTDVQTETYTDTNTYHTLKKRTRLVYESKHFFSRTRTSVPGHRASVATTSLRPVTSHKPSLPALIFPLLYLMQRLITLGLQAYANFDETAD